MSESESWKVRGIGSDYNLKCFVTGEERDLMPNISGFVRSKEAGERVVAMFDGRARLDFRPSEPNWIQVKVGALPEHMPALQDLYRYAAISGQVSPKAIEAAKTSSPFAELNTLKSQRDLLLEVVRPFAELAAKYSLAHPSDIVASKGLGALGNACFRIKVCDLRKARDIRNEILIGGDKKDG
ncbi:MAG: hypothetical protein JSR78_10560 [Proteobacteria bacterium]|nr:hypothetical protein [Pseudomonadota bacterium]